MQTRIGGAIDEYSVTVSAIVTEFAVTTIAIDFVNTCSMDASIVDALVYVRFTMNSCKAQIAITCIFISSFYAFSGYTWRAFAFKNVISTV